MGNPEAKNIERDGGSFTSTVTDDDILAAVEEHSPAATREVGEAVGMTRPGAHNRLADLHDSGKVNKKTIGGSLVWFLD
jgi:DNA-binding Lrp family transcriptional regulator